LRHIFVVTNFVFDSVNSKLSLSQKRKERGQGVKYLHCCRFVLVMGKCVDVTSTLIKMTEAIFQLLLEIQVVKKFSALSTVGRSQWLCVLRRGSAAARLLELRVRIPPETWKPVSFLCFVLCR